MQLTEGQGLPFLRHELKVIWNHEVEEITQIQMTQVQHYMATFNIMTHDLYSLTIGSKAVPDGKSFGILSSGQKGIKKF